MATRSKIRPHRSRGLAKQKNAVDRSPADPFAALYPNVAEWLHRGWVEVGWDDCSKSFVRVLDIGGMVWEGEASYPTPHAAFQALDTAIAAWLNENG